MQTLPRSNPRKRQHPDQYPSQLRGTCQSVWKKHKAASRESNEQPAAFWDSLSEIPLTKRALRELDRRNARATPTFSTPQRSRRPVSRGAVQERERYHPPFKTVTSFLVDCTNSLLNSIKSFSRHGGPNLSDIRGVCNTHSFTLVLTCSVSKTY